MPLGHLVGVLKKIMANPNWSYQSCVIKGYKIFAAMQGNKLNSSNY